MNTLPFPAKIMILPVLSSACLDTYYVCVLNTGMRWLLAPEPDPQLHQVPAIEDLLCCDEYLQHANKVEWLRNKLAVSPDIIKNVRNFIIS